MIVADILKITPNRTPDFDNILKILKREKPTRPTPFEFIISDNILNQFNRLEIPKDDEPLKRFQFNIAGFQKAGYDFAVVGGWQFKALEFPKDEVHTKQSKSLNEGAVIKDRKSFKEYPWPNPENGDYSIFDDILPHIPDGMKLIVSGCEGVLETVIDLVGFDNLCYMLYEDPELTSDIFNAVGSRILTYYEKCAPYDSIGALIANDDWGFKTQTMLSPNDLRQYVFPWHKKIAETCHAAGKPVILHSCGNLVNVMDDVIDDIKIDGKHSYEDNIVPVEDAIERWSDRIAIIGGMDINFLSTSSAEEVANRTAQIIKLSDKGGVAIGSGNSIPDYIPIENYCALLHTVYTA